LGTASVAQARDDPDVVRAAGEAAQVDDGDQSVVGVAPHDRDAASVDPDLGGADEALSAVLADPDRKAAS
jgi:hypothetical protein